MVDNDTDNTVAVDAPPKRGTAWGFWLRALLVIPAAALAAGLAVLRLDVWLTGEVQAGVACVAPAVIVGLGAVYLHRSPIGRHRADAVRVGMALVGSALGTALGIGTGLLLLLYLALSSCDGPCFS